MTRSKKAFKRLIFIFIGKRGTRPQPHAVPVFHGDRGSCMAAENLRYQCEMILASKTL